MPDSSPRRSSFGFSLIELLVVVLLISVLALLSAPAIGYWIRRSRHEGIARETSGLLQRAKLQAVRDSVPVVVRLDYDTDEVIAFADFNDADGDPVSDLIFNPVAGATDGTTDYLIGRLRLPARVSFWGAGDAAAEGAEAVLGFTAIAGQSPNAVVFEPNGSVRNRGAFRFGDDRENYIEALVSPEATARIQIRKHHPDWEDPPDDTFYFPPGRGERNWRWNE